MARIYKLSENWFTSAGIALLFLSVVMIPSAFKTSIQQKRRVRGFEADVFG